MNTHASSLLLKSLLCGLLPTALVAQFPGACILEDAAFATGTGGCTDLTSGLTWSQGVYPNLMTHDNAVLYAEQLQDGGFDDWRLPTIDELVEVAGNGGGTHLNLADPNYYFWAANRRGNRGYLVDMTGDVIIVNNLAGSYNPVICVRGGGGSGGPGNGNGNGNGKGNGGGGGGGVDEPGTSGSPRAVQVLESGGLAVHLTAPEHAGRAFVVVAGHGSADQRRLIATPSGLAGSVLLDARLQQIDDLGRATLRFGRDATRAMADEKTWIAVVVLAPERDSGVADVLIVARPRKR